MSVASDGTITLDSGTVYYDATGSSLTTTSIGTVSGGTSGTDLVVTLNSDSTSAGLTALMQAVTYANGSDNPDATDRTATFTLDDGDGDSNTASAAVTITIAAVNDAPTLGSLDGTTLAYTEGDGAVVVDSSDVSSVSDADSIDFDGGSLTTRSSLHCLT